MVMIEKEEQLKIFLEMRNAEDKSCNNVLINKDSKDLDLRSDLGHFQNSPKSKIKSSVPSPKISPDEFLNSENEKSDYNWLLTPPGTPLIPPMEVERQKDETSTNDMPSFHPTALKQKVINIQTEPVSKKTMASKPNSIQSEILSNPKATIKPSLSGGAGPAKTTKPSRPASPTPQNNLLSSAKFVAPFKRSSTPTGVAARSSTPTARSSKLTPRSRTPTRGPSSAADCSDLSGRSRRASSASKSRSTLTCNSGPLRGSSPTVKARPVKHAEIHGLSNDSVPKEKPRETNVSSLIGRSNGNPRRQLSSPFRRGLSDGYCGGKLFPTMQRTRPSDDDEVNPVLIGSKMVERVVNMRKLAPPERDDHQSNLGNSAPRTADSSGFGRTLSKTSLDMALRHMDITRSVPVKFRPVSNMRASSLHDDSSSLEKSSAGSAVDSPLARSNDGSSEPCLSNNSACVGKDIEDDDFGSEEEFFVAGQLKVTPKP